MPEKIHFGDEENADLDLVRRIVLLRLRHAPVGTAESTATFDSGYGEVVDFSSPSHAVRFLELADTVLWELVTLGVLLPGSGQGGNVANFNLPNYRVTDYGKLVFASEK